MLVLGVGGLGPAHGAPSAVVTAGSLTSASDSFDRTVAAGWGSAPSGGPWTLCGGTCSAAVSVASGTGRMTLAAAQAADAVLGDFGSTSAELAATMSVDRAATGGGTYLALMARGVSGASYRGKLRIRTDGGVDLTVVRTSGSTDTALASGSLPAATVAPGTKLRVKVQAGGSAPTTLRLKAWVSGAAEPSWQVQASDSTSGLQVAGSIGVWGYVSGSATNGPTTVSVDDLAAGPISTAVPAPPPPTSVTPKPVTNAGARLPISYSLSSLQGTVRYVSPSGSDTSGTGTLAQPYRTLPKAESVSANGDSIVLRGGTYPIASNATFVDRTGLDIVAYPGETPVFDGSIAAPSSASSDGSLRYVSYQPMRAGLAEGVVISHLPVATFSGGSPTGLAAQRGWRCVSGSSYSTPAPTSADPDGCSGTPVVMTGYYPDQVWVNGNPLQQVLDKSRVTTGTFWLSRTASTDASPGVTNLYLSSTDAADMSKVRVSSSSGAFLQVAADGVRLEGVQIQRHSPGGSYYSVVVAGGSDDFTMRNVRFDSNAGISFKLAGGDNADGSRLVRRATIDRVTVTRAGFMGAAMINADDTLVRDSVFQGINTQKEFRPTPVSGAIKATKTHRMVVRDSLFDNAWGHGLWWDQSNYDATVANSAFLNNTHSSVFIEISHGLTMVNNYIRGPASGPGDEGHSAVRLAGSSGIRMVNNTIVGSPIGIGVYTDQRSKKYDSNGDGTADRWCSEHTVRYRQGGNAGSACNSPYASDFDMSHPGAYSPTGAANQTPNLTWMPQIQMMVNNVIAYQAPAMSDGWTPCGGRIPLCVYGYLNSPTIDVALNSIFSSSAVIDGNVYQSSGTLVAALYSRGSSASTGTFKAADLTALKGTSGFGSSYYRKTVETAGRSGSGWVASDGSATSQLSAIQGQAYPVPTDAKVNPYVPSGTRSYGYRG